MPPREARCLIETRQAAARDPQGKLIRFGADVGRHWASKSPADRDNRMRRIREAFAAVREPQEMWEEKGERFYCKAFEPESGGIRRMLVIASEDGRVATWIPNDAPPAHDAFAAKRKGTLLIKEGAR